MPVLQRLRFPKTPDELPLYAVPGHGAVVSDQGCTFQRGAELSLDSFFNACFIGGNGWPSYLAPNIFCNLFLEGDFRVLLCVRESHGNERTILETVARGCIPEKSLSFPLDQTYSHLKPYRVFPRLRALSDTAAIHGGNYGCSRVGEPVTLGIVICTYRREREAIQNARLLAMEKDLISAQVQVVVVDNARTIDPASLPERVILVQNHNLGGAGGFSRGLMELLDRRGCSHVVLMDDDVNLDTECISRCVNHFRHRPEGPAIAGVLFDVDSPSMVHEAGAWMGKTGSPLVVRPGFIGVDLTDPSILDALSLAPRPDYGGFWIFAFPLSLVRRHLLMPFFIKGDDVEFGLRLQKQGVGCTLLPGVGVRHPGFLGSFDVVKRFYWVRNMLIVEMLHGQRSILSMVLPLLSEAWIERHRGRYAHLTALVRGMEDFLKGPERLEHADNDLLMSSLKKEQNHLLRRSGERMSLLLFLRAIVCFLKMTFTMKTLRATWRRTAWDLASMKRWKERFST
jgi:galactofuranosylgalactofuranosylrhamnosyl-N-acetylglucosaminyl-diphospho-decaprenol beta-1,5/1,6-galactofuranosyltransferase